MKKKTQPDASVPAPKGASLEKADVWLPVERKRLLEKIATQENRSANKQAVHFIEQGMDGMNFMELARRVERMDAKLDAILSELGRRKA